MSRKPSGILIIQSMGLGDVLFALPSVQALKKQYPEEPIGFVTAENHRDLLRLIPEVDFIFTYKEKTPEALFRMAAEIQGYEFRTCFVFNPIFRGSVLAWLSGIPERIGYLHDFERKQSLHGLDWLLLTKTYLPRNQKIHEAVRYLDLLKMHGETIPTTVNGYQLSLPDEEKSHAIQTLHPAAGKKKVFINLGAAWDMRLWPLDRMAALSGKLESKGLQIVLAGTHRDQPSASAIKLQAPHAIDLTGKLSLSEFTAVMAQCDLMISPDTGPVHIAAALNIPAIALFGPGDLGKVRPLSDKVRALYHPITCSPCQVQYTQKCRRSLCMEAITLDEVLSHAESVLNLKLDAPPSVRPAVPVKSKQRILYLQSTSEIGGTDISLLRTLETLDKNQFEAHVLLPKEGPFVESYRQTGALVHFLPSMRKLTSRKGPLYLLFYILGYFPAVLQIAALMEREKIDLVHTNTLHNLYGFLAARMAGKPHVWHVREIVVQSRLVRCLEVFLAKHFSTRIVVMDNAIAEAFRIRKGGFPASLRKVYEGIDVQRFHPSKAGTSVRAEIGIPENAALVGMVSRLDPWKGPDIFLQAAAQVLKTKPSVQFLLCGGEIEGHEGYEAKLKSIADSLGITKSVHFTGWRYKTNRMPEVFRSLTISVQCPVNPEPYGLVNIEAMASGIPVVATAEAGPLEICVNQETALLVPPKDPTAAAKAILVLLEKPEDAKEMGLKGRKRAETFFDMSRCIRDLEAVYRELLPHA